MTQFSAILVGNESLLRHAAETLRTRGHRIELKVGQGRVRRVADVLCWEPGGPDRP
ncbi:MAG TPA: hypothetical protein PLI13_06910 [Paracoccus sp. (in: a-proteobacteria)]|nr:hypothetical protein [Paracoccus sp. (in: a-proteobacteria)]